MEISGTSEAVEVSSSTSLFVVRSDVLSMLIIAGAGANVPTSIFSVVVKTGFLEVLFVDFKVGVVFEENK